MFRFSGDLDIIELILLKAYEQPDQVTRLRTQQIAVSTHDFSTQLAFTWIQLLGSGFSAY